MGIKINPLTKKSQITMFILVGLVLLIISALLFHLVSLRSEEKGQAVVQRMTSDALKAENIQNYVTSCVDDALDKALLVAGLQGGFANTTFIASSIPLGSNPVPYLITPKPISFPPVYPCDTADNPPFYCQFKNDIKKFPSLPSYSFGSNKLPTLGGSYAFSVQRQLESFIADYTTKCTNFSELIRIPGLADYNISEEPPSAELVFSDDGVFVVLTYPVIVMPHGQKPIKTLLRFYSKSYVRFKLVHSAVEELLTLDNRDLDFDLLVNTSVGFFKGRELKFNRLKPGISLQQSLSGEDTVYIITDDDSSVGSQPFVFRFARKNRPPVLDYIPEQIINTSSLTHTHSFPVFAFDPDEDPLSFSSLSPDAVVRDVIPYRSGWQSSVDLFVRQSNIGNHSFIVSASDGFQSDSQEVLYWVCDSDKHIGHPDTCVSKCGASFQCNDRLVGHQFSSCSVNPYLFDSCNGSCIFASSDICASGDGCSAHPDCDGLPSFAVTSGYWCTGDFGCGSKCTDAIVYKFASVVLPVDDDFVCGCAGHSGSPCDLNYDLVFNGRCVGGVCQGDT